MKKNVMGAQKALCFIVADEAGDDAIALLLTLTWETGSAHCSPGRSFQKDPFV
jgi:hypothetical protein